VLAAPAEELEEIVDDVDVDVEVQAAGEAEEVEEAEEAEEEDGEKTQITMNPFFTPSASAPPPGAAAVGAPMSASPSTSAGPSGIAAMNGGAEPSPFSVGRLLGGGVGFEHDDDAPRRSTSPGIPFNPRVTLPPPTGSFAAPESLLGKPLPPWSPPPTPTVQRQHSGETTLVTAAPRRGLSRLFPEGRVARLVALGGVGVLAGAILVAILPGKRAAPPTVAVPAPAAVRQPAAPSVVASSPRIAAVTPPVAPLVAPAPPALPHPEIVVAELPSSAAARDVVAIPARRAAKPRRRRPEFRAALAPDAESESPPPAAPSPTAVKERPPAPVVAVPVKERAVAAGAGAGATEGASATDKGGSCTMTVGSKPWTEVWIDGKNTNRRTPLVDYKLPCGEHKLLLKRDDIDVYQMEVITVEAGTPFKKSYPLD
jgi:hypothetical protein